jgi:hypothetical protein
MLCDIDSSRNLPFIKVIQLFHGPQRRPAWLHLQLSKLHLSLYSLDILISKIHSALVSTSNSPRLLERYLCDQKRRPFSFSLPIPVVLNVDVTHVAHISLTIGGNAGLLKGAAVK